MFYCPSCRQNLDASLKKNHNYQPFHKKWRDELIEKVVTRVSESRLFLKNVMRSKPGLEEPFNCPFCEEAIEQSQNKTICFAFFKHLSQASHIDRTTTFINTTGAPDYVIQKCSITKEEFRMYVHKSSKLLREDAPVPAVYPLDESDAAPLPQVFVPLPPPVVQAPAPATPAPPIASYKTYISKDGILQNASGFHEGKRVWGGGIVRVPKEEWVAWPIDLESVELQPKVRAPAISDEAPRVATEYATGEGVSFLGSHTLRPGEGNVYTGAKPPWEMDDDATSTPIAGPQPRGVPAAAASTAFVSSRPDRSKRARDDEETNPDTWLPNFGGTFHIGSRRDFKAAFREELETEHRHKLAEKRPTQEGDAGPPVVSYTSRRAQATGAAALAAAAPERPMLQPFVARPSVPSTAGTAPSPAPPSAAPRPAPAALAPTPAAAPLAPYVSSRAAHVAVAAPHRDVPSRPAPVPAPPAPQEPAVAKVALSEAMQRKREELIKRAQGLVRTYPSVDMALN